MKSKWIKIILVPSIVVLCVLLDQVSKLIAINNLVELEPVTIIDNFFYWTLCYNTGGAWSIFSDSTIALALISIVALGFMIYTVVKSKNKGYIICSSIFMGGLVGNLIDRLVNQKVTDFIDFKIFGYDFPVFNIADIFIVLSSIAIMIVILKEEKKDGKENS